jgi:putative membrane protein
VKRAGYIALIVGIALVVGLVSFQGAGDVVNAIGAAGWGLIAVILVRMVPIALDGYVWRFLFLEGSRPPVMRALWARWIGEAINTLIPAFQVGGALVRARLMVMHGVPGRLAGASVVVDLTLSTLTQLLFTIVGLGLLLAHYGNSDIAKGVGAGVAAGFVVVAALCIFQQRGLFSAVIKVMARIARGRAWDNAIGGASALDAAILALYRERWLLTANATGQLAAWALGAAEIYAALYFMGYPVSIADAVLLESLILATRTAAFFVPGALGVQEGVFVLLGGVIGLGPEVALALSLVKRVRELVIGVPGLIAWQIAEGKNLLKRSKEKGEEPQSTPPAASTLQSGISRAEGGASALARTGGSDAMREGPAAGSTGATTGFTPTTARHSLDQPRSREIF